VLGAMVEVAGFSAKGPYMVTLHGMGLVPGLVLPNTYSICEYFGLTVSSDFRYLRFEGAYDFVSNATAAVRNRPGKPAREKLPHSTGRHTRVKSVCLGAAGKQHK
jgi:hypothetical protein